MVWDANDIAVWVDLMRTLRDGVARTEGEMHTIVRRQLALDFKTSEFPEMEQLKNEIRPVLQLWETIE